MNIKLQKLTLINFKGLKEFTSEFGQNTTISGDNATGKTTLADAFSWLLFDKNSAGKDTTNFNLKTLDKNGDPIHNLDHEVIGILAVGGTLKELKKVYKENWVKRRNSGEKVLEGHTTKYFIDGAPYKKSEYEREISAIIDEGVFKMITSPAFFPSLHWSKQREALFRIAGNVSDTEILAQDKFKDLADRMTGKPLEKLKAQVAGERTRLRAALRDIPARISEVNRQIPGKIDYNAVAEQIKEHEAQIAEIEKQLINDSKRLEAANKKRLEAKKQVYNLEARLDKITSDVKKEKQARVNAADELVTAKKAELRKINQQIKDTEADIKAFTSRIQVQNANIEKLRAEWKAESDKQITFPDNIMACPTCKRAYDTDDISSKKQELSENFNRAKVKTLEEINARGKEMTVALEELKADLGGFEGALPGLLQKRALITSELEKAERTLSAAYNDAQSINPEGLEEFIKVKEELNALENSSVFAVSTGDGDNSVLINEKAEISYKLDQLKKQLTAKDTEEKLRARIQELEKQEEDLNAQLADAEKIEEDIKLFEREKVEAAEEKVNRLFSRVKFKMFNRLVNGEFDDTCEATVNGVPYADLNTADKINAGLDIINTLTNYYGITAPIFIDNAEAVNELIPTRSQLIRLIVSKFKTLTVNVEERAEVQTLNI